MNVKTKELGKQLAQKIVEVENKIQNIMENGESNFDTFQHEEGEWAVQTSFCQMGGCVAGYIPCDSEEKANRKAAEMTLRGLKPSYSGLCPSCSAEMREMQM